MGSGASGLKSAANIEFLADNSGIWQGNDHFLSRELLHGLNQKSGGAMGMGVMGNKTPAVDHEIGRRRSFSKNTKFTLEKENELPLSTQTFLKNIGIGDNGSGKTSRITHNEQKTKLVSHVFDCLGALEQLVELDQQFSSNELQSVNETQSVCDRNINSVGKLIHELVSIYGLCGDSLKVLLESQPEAAGVEDAAGRMALHVAVDKHKPWIRLIDTLVDAYPTACKMRDGGGRLPLHIAVDRNNPSVEVVRAVIRGYPEAASKHRGVGRLPLHYAVFYDQPSVEVVEYLLEVFREGAAVVDVYGRLPLHYAVDRPRPNARVVELLLKAYPEGSKLRDNTSNLPLNIALDHGAVKSVEIVKMLIDSHPESITELNSHGRMPLHSVLYSPEPDVGVARYLARLYPRAITLESKEGLNDSPIALSKEYGFVDILRTLLSVRPEISPSDFADLNWEARRLGVLISVPLLFKTSCKSGNHLYSRPFQLSPSASTTLPTSNIVTDAVTDDLNIVTYNDQSGSEELTERHFIQRERERDHQRELSEYNDDIEWLLVNKTYANLQANFVKLYTNDPKLWRRIIMYL